MAEYLQIENKCRSRYIGNYFGDDEMKACGICDNCLKLKSTALTSQEFKTISAAIVDKLNGSGISVNDLLSLFPQIKKEKLWKVIDYLQAEEKIKMNEAGVIMRTT